MNKWIILSIAFTIAVLASGCVEQTAEQASASNASTEPPAIEHCISLCRVYISEGRDISNGPCLSDKNPNWNVNGWVCDIAHVPREDVDNNPDNQCLDYRSGKSHRFVELDPDCNLIKAV